MPSTTFASARSLAFWVTACLGAVANAMPVSTVFPLLGQPTATVRPMKSQSLAFVQNLGQWDAQAQFLARAKGTNVWITDRGVVYDFYKIEDSAAIADLRFLIADSPDNQQSKINNQRSIRGQVVRMEFVGGSPSAVSGKDRLEGDHNYFIGTDESRWASNVPRYSEASSERIYPGVSARWYFDHEAPRYDLVVEPGADAAQIAMRFEGADSVSTDGKTLTLATSLGAIEHRGLFAYQKIGNRMQQVSCSFKATGNTVQFVTGPYDKTRRLVIDPLVWSSFLGAATFDFAVGTAVDSAGNAFVAGYTNSAAFPTTVGAYDTKISSLYDVSVSKLSPDGSTLLFSSFMGGNDHDDCYALVLDSAGNPVIVGESLSTNFPTTAGVYDRSNYDPLIDVSQDGFAAKLSANGSTLKWSTFLGGVGQMLSRAVALDVANNPVIAGVANFRFSPAGDAFDTEYSGGFDAAVVKITQNGNGIFFGTYLGGFGNDEPYAVVLDAANNPIVCGVTESSGFPRTGNAPDSSYAGGEAFATKFKADGSELMFSTFLGGSSFDFITAAKLDAAGNVVVAGYTGSSDFPITSGAWDLGLAGTVESFVSKLSPNGSSVLFSTFLGGKNTDFVRAMDLDSAGNIVLCGQTNSPDFPKTLNAFDRSYAGGYDAFITRMSSNGSNVLYSTFAGGPQMDFATAIDLDNGGNPLVAGWTYLSGFPSTEGAYDTTDNGSYDMFAAKFLVAPPTVFPNLYGTTPDTPLVVSAPGVLGNDLGSPTSAVLVSSPSNAAAFSLNADGSFNYTPNAGFIGTDTFTYRALNAVGQSSPATVTINVYPQRDAVFVSQSVPPIVAPGSSFAASVTMKNKGLDTWSAPAGFRLMSQNPKENLTWGISTIAIPPDQTTPTGANRTFTGRFVAPSVPGVYNFQWQMDKTGDGNFGQLSQNVAILVSNTERDAQFVSQIVPGVVAPGASFQAKVTMRNIGTTAWTEATGFRMMSQNPFDNATWGFKRMFIAGADTVKPGATYQFVKTFFAPTTPGLYNFQWRMHKEGTGNFGAFTQNIQIAVTTTPRDAQFISQSVPTSIPRGSTFSASITMRNIGTDTWSEANGFRLMSQNPFDNANWGFRRFFILNGATVKPGNSYTFTRNLTAPSTPGTYNFQWRMQKEGTGNFGQITVNVVITVT